MRAPIRSLPFAAVVTMVVLAAERAGAQSGPSAPASVAEVERAGDAARDAQARFERDRVRWLPLNRGWSGGDCDEVLGRICWSDEGAGDWYPGSEDSRIVAAREELIRALAAAAELAPLDRWVLEQRVVYLGEAGRWEEALALARACEAGPCPILVGLALHALGRYVEAEEAFRQGIAAMGPARAARFSDPEWLLDEAGRGWWSRLDDGERALRAPLVWALADPLLLVPGNDLLTEHWARRTSALIRAEARNPYGMSWGDDLEELHVRYGPEVGWERLEGSVYAAPGPASVVGHHHPESRPLFPPGAALRDPAAAPERAWTAEGRDGRSEYAPLYAPVLLPGAGQIAVFPRGERIVVVGHFALPEDTTRHAAHEHPARDSVAPPWRGRPDEAGLFLVPAEDPASPVVSTRVVGQARGRLALEAPAGRWVASLEVFSPSLRRAGRARMGIDRPPLPPDVLTLSDLLLVEGALPAEATLDDAAARALPRTWVRAGERIGVAWELFGLGFRDEVLSYRLGIVREGEGVLRRALRSLRLAGPEREQRLEWEESAPGRPGPALRSVELELPPLPPGWYRLRLEVHTAGRSALVRDLPIELRP